MSLFQCENCGSCENTALAAQGFKSMKHLFDWSYAPGLEGKMLCSVCGPTQYISGKSTPFGKWHDRFDRVLLPIGEFHTNQQGNLEHTETGSTNFEEFGVANEL